MLVFRHLLCNQVSGVDRNRMNPHAHPCGTPYLTWMHSNTGLHRELQQEREKSDHCQVRHRYRNALHLRQTKYVWHSMEAVVNKKYPKDKQALELFQYKSSLRFCVPPIFSINGRCGPRGVTYSRHVSGHCSKKTVDSHFSVCLLENVNPIGSLLPMGG